MTSAKASHVIICPDTSGKSCALYFATEEQYLHSRVLRLGRFIADKVALEDAVIIAVAMRDADDAKPAHGVTP